MVLETGRVVAVGDGVVQPGGALERRLAVEGRVDPARHGRRGGEPVGLEPAGAELEPVLALGDHVGGRQPAVVGLGLRQLDVDRGLVVQDALRPRRVDGCLHPARVAGQVVGVAQRDLQPRHALAPLGGVAERPADGPRASGHHDGDRDVLGDLGQGGVGDHEGADQVGPPLVGPVDVRRQRLGQRSVPGREHRRVVDQSSPGFGKHPLTLARRAAVCRAGRSRVGASAGQFRLESARLQLAADAVGLQIRLDFDAVRLRTAGSTSPPGDEPLG